MYTTTGEQIPLGPCSVYAKKEKKNHLLLIFLFFSFCNDSHGQFG